MADQIISSANLSYIESNLNTLANEINRVNQNVDYIKSEVYNVNSKVDNLYSELEDLIEEFREFVDEANRTTALADAKQTVVMLEQKLKKDFGAYDSVRKHIIGILQASDLSIVKKDTISTATEELMLSVPRYWLAPALIALSAWVSDKKDLAERALKEAIHRDDEKTSLLFCLICRRYGRLNSSLVWLERYFSIQDPIKMEDRVIVVLDAFASGVFGLDAKGMVSTKIKSWIDELSSRDGFVEAQKEQWSTALLGKQSFVDDDEFPYLKDNSSTWPVMKQVLGWAKTHNDVHTYFKSIFDTPIQNITSLTKKIDEILDNLVKNYDDEELPLRKELRRNQLVIEEVGIADRANSRFKAEIDVYEQQYSDFSKHLTDAALNHQKSNASVATQKLAISLSKEWILNAYEDLTLKSRSKIPIDIEFEISNWSGSTRDGSNEAELQSSLNLYIDRIKESALLKIKWFSSKIIIAVIIGLILFFIGLSTVVIPILAIVGVGVYIYMERNKAEKNKKATINEMERFRNDIQNILKAILAEVVDYRRLYAEKDADYVKVIDFINELSPEQYIFILDSQKTRQVL